MTEQTPPPKRVNLAQFESIEDAVSKVEQAREYLAIAKEYLVVDDLELPMLFLGSMINRCESLHMAIAREMREQNPHAVFPLLRAYSECAALLIYVYDHVEYIEALTDKPNKRRNPLGVGKLVAYATKQAAPGFQDAHDELNVFTHFGTTAIDDNRLSSTSIPRWKGEEQAMTAAALTLEVSKANHQLLRSFGDRYLRPGRRWRGSVSRWFRRAP